MTQAIGRARRYGQQKRVYIYRFAALSTIDVDILEHREHRSDALWDLSTIEKGGQPPGPEAQKETDPSKRGRTKLVRDADGNFVLVPRYWLTEGTWITASTAEDFASLVKFSQAFMEETFDD